jgi:hypothetical protein
MVECTPANVLARAVKKMLDRKNKPWYITYHVRTAGNRNAAGVVVA